MRQELTLTIGILTVSCVQEQYSRWDMRDLQRQLQSSEALVADFKKILQQRDLELEVLWAKVSIRSYE